MPSWFQMLEARTVPVMPDAAASPAAETAAGGIEGGIGARPFEVLRTRIDRVALVSEEEIFGGVRWMLETHQHLIEPSAAAAVAACLSGKAGRFEGPVIVVISGRNVSLETLRKILGASRV